MHIPNSVRESRVFSRFSAWFGSLSYPIRQFLLFAPLDFTAAVAAYMLTFAVRLVGLPYRDFNLTYVLVAALIVVGMLYLFGVYRRLWSASSGHDVIIIVRAVVAATTLIVLLGLPYEQRPMPLSVTIVGGLLSVGSVIAIRYRSRLTGEHFSYPRSNERRGTSIRVLIVGANAGQNLALQLRRHMARTPYVVVGFIDDDPDKQGMYIEGKPIFGGRSDIPAIVERYQVDLIGLALPEADGSTLREVLSYCERTPARIKVVPDVLTAMDSDESPILLRDVRLEDLIGRGAISRYEGIDLDPVLGKRVLVTGAAGSIGSELSRQIASYEPETLVLLDNNESDLHGIHEEIAAKYPGLALVPVLLDLTQRDAVRDLFAAYTPQVIFHCAAYKHVPMLERYPQQAVRVNVGGTHNLMEAASDFCAERFVLISTDKAIRPTSVMGASKRVCELLLHAFSQKQENRILFTAVRFGNVLGSRGSVVPMFTQQIEHGGPVTVTDPNMTRYFMTIPEAVNLVIHAACLTVGDDIFVLNMGELIRIVELAERMIRLRGLRPHIDIKIIYTGVRPGEKLFEELYTSAEHPTPTVHPKIIKVDTWGDYSEGWFWDRLERILACEDDSEVRRLLTDLAQLAQPAKVAQA